MIRLLTHRGAEHGGKLSDRLLMWRFLFSWLILDSLFLHSATKYIVKVLCFTEILLRKVKNSMSTQVYVNKLSISWIQTACKLYSNITSRWSYGTGTRVFDGTLAVAGEFPWMVLLLLFNIERLINSILLCLLSCKGCFGLFESTIQS